MSTAGVSESFSSVAGVLERSLVAWSGVVGEFFSNDRNVSSSSRRKRETRLGVTTEGVITRGIINEEDLPTEFGVVKVRCVSVHKHGNGSAARHSSVRVLGTDPPARSSSAHWLFRPAFTQDPAALSISREPSSILRKGLSRRGLTIKDDRERRRKPSFRESAILPTQRVTRYVLLYKGLYWTYHIYRCSLTVLSCRSFEVYSIFIPCVLSGSGSCRYGRSSSHEVRSSPKQFHVLIPWLTLLTSFIPLKS